MYNYGINRSLINEATVKLAIMFSLISYLYFLIGPISTKIVEKLSEALNPSHLQVINESHMHSVPKGSETHFKVVVVTKSFDGLPLIKVS